MNDSVAEPTTNESAAEASMSEPAEENNPSAEQAEGVDGKQEQSEEVEPADDDSSNAMEVETSVKEPKLESEAGEEVKPYKRNGASRKRFKWLLDQGYSRNAAAQIARTPFKPKEMREKYIAETGFFKEKVNELEDDAWAELSDQAKKRAKWLMKNGYAPEEALKLAKGINTNNRGGPGKRSAEPKESLMVAVMATDYPKTLLTTAQSDEVKAAILNEVVQHKDSELKPHFKNSVHVNGYLRIQCSDEQTRRWLQAAVAKLTVPEGISLKVATEKNHLKGGVFTGHFPDSLNDTNETILEFIESQNDGIVVSEWTILTRKELSDTKTVKLMFTVDFESARSLQKIGYELNYKFNTVRLRKQSQPGSSSTNGPNPKMRRNFNQIPSLLGPNWNGNMSGPNWNSNTPRHRGGSGFNQFRGRGNFRGGFNNRNMPQNGNRPFDFVDNLFDQLNQITGVNQWGSNQGFNSNGPRRNYNGPDNRNVFRRRL